MNEDLYTMLRSPRKQEYLEAVEALRGIKSTKAVELLDGLCNEGDSELRGRGLDGLVEIAPQRAEAVAIQMLGDVHRSVRTSAIYSAWKLGSRDAVPVIAMLLRTDPEEVVRGWAAFALGDMADASALPALEEAAANDQGTDHEGVPNSKTARMAIQKIMQRASR